MARHRAVLDFGRSLVNRDGVDDLPPAFACVRRPPCTTRLPSRAQVASSFFKAPRAWTNSD
jgi:hypothetical protein